MQTITNKEVPQCSLFIHHALTACTELYLGNRGIEKIRGFEPYENLTTLWLNNNKLKKINNLDANFRIKALYVQVSMGVVVLCL